MRFGFAYRPAVRRRAGGSASAPPAINSVAANGWQAVMVSPAELALSPVTLSRQGYDATGAATTISDTLYTAKRVRQPYPNQASLTVASVALSDYVLSTDTIAGVTNSSAETSPKPIANWVTPDRALLGNSIGGSGTRVELAAFHYHGRNGKQVAAVKFLITDGTTTISAVVSTPTVSGRTGDQNADIVYALPTTDITSLAEGLITVNAEV